MSLLILFRYYKVALTLDDTRGVASVGHSKLIRGNYFLSFYLLLRERRKAGEEIANFSSSLAYDVSVLLILLSVLVDCCWSHSR